MAVERMKTCVSVDELAKELGVSIPPPDAEGSALLTLPRQGILGR